MSEVITNMNNTYKIEFAYRNGQTVTFSKINGQWYDTNGKETSAEKIIAYMNKNTKPCDVTFSTFDRQTKVITMKGLKRAVCGQRYRCDDLYHNMDEAFRSMI